MYWESSLGSSQFDPKEDMILTAFCPFPWCHGWHAWVKYEEKVAGRGETREEAIEELHGLHPETMELPVKDLHPDHK